LSIRKRQKSISRKTGSKAIRIQAIQQKRPGFCLYKQQSSIYYEINSVEIFDGLLKDSRDTIAAQMRRDSVSEVKITEFKNSFPIPPNLNRVKDIFGDILGYLSFLFSF